MRVSAIAMTLLLAMTCMRAAETGSVSGFVRDPGGHPLANAAVQIQSESSGARWKIATDGEGHYQATQLPAGRYKVTVRLPGFRTVSRTGALLTAQGVALDFTMELLRLHEFVTVVSGRDKLDPASGDGLLMTRESAGATLPANGSDYRMLFDLLPGVVVTPASVSDGGQFTSNGQRPNASEFRVDGVSANGGLGGSTLPGSFPGVSLPAMSAIGSTENLGSPETTQTVELQTSTFAVESGGRPGAEVSITTRSGSNDVHAEFDGHIRDSAWSARDWFANTAGFPFPRPQYEAMGAAVGGPIRRNRTFFFLSGEVASLQDDGVELTAVPTLAARASAAPALQQLLDYLPAPTGPNLGGGMGVSYEDLSTVGTVSHSSVRIDQVIGPHTVAFFRLVESPSHATSALRGSEAHSSWQSITAGLTTEHFGIIDDVRFSNSVARLATSQTDSVGGPPNFFSTGILLGLYFTGTASPLYAPLSDDVVLGLSVPGLGQFISSGMGTARQSQWELRNTVAKVTGAHQIRAGFDAFSLSQARGQSVATILGSTPSLTDLLDNDPVAVTYSQVAPYGDGPVYTASFFAQDTFSLSRTLSLVYGLRWEFTPPATFETYPNPTVTGLWNGTTWQTLYQGYSVNGPGPWPMNYRQFTPRLGMAWRVPVGGLVLRAGAGAFRDTTLGPSIDPISGAPFNSWLFSSGEGISVSNGFSGGSTTPSGTSITPDVQQFLTGTPPGLELPTSWQWRTSLEKNARRGVASATYAGSVGRHLLGNEAYVDPTTGVLERFTTLTQNQSEYEALELRYSGSPGANIYVSAAYTWSHSLDEGSEDSSVFLIHPGYQLREAWASSDFDVRHALTASVSWHIPRALESHTLPDWLRGWTLSGILRARTGFPINILTSEQSLGEQFDNAGRPDLVAGLPLWIPDPNVAGGRRLNSAAFTTPPAGEEGALGRNAIYGNGLAQIDGSVRRSFALFGSLTAEVGLTVFNLLNHPQFADPVPYLASPFFGQSVSMQNLMLGSGSPNTGLPPLFQTGGSRSAEFDFRFAF